MKQYRYAHTPKPDNERSSQGRKVDRSTWKYGPDDYTHESHYAWLKHRSQARYRGEEYHLTFEQWHTLWTPDTLAQRGRNNHSLILTRLNWDEPWDIVNVHVVTRPVHSKLQGENRKRKNRDRKA